MAIFDAVRFAVACFPRKAGAAEPADQAATQIRTPGSEMLRRVESRLGRAMPKRQ